MNVLVVGLGEIGMPLYEIIKESRKYDVFGIDPKIKSNEEIPTNVDIIHICIPCSDVKVFVGTVIDYVQSFQPKLLIIDSTVLPRTTDKIAKKCDCMVVYSPTFGSNSNGKSFKSEIRFFGKLIGGITTEATVAAIEHFNNIGIKIIGINKSPLEAEITKLYCTTYYGTLIALSQEFHRISLSVGADFSEITRNICLLNEKSPFHTKPPVYPDVIGGHCVMPNIELILSFYDSTLLKAIKKSNEKRKEEIQNPDISKEISKTKGVVEGFKQRDRVIKPLLTIASPRDISWVKEAFDKITYVDKLWIKYYTQLEAYSVAQKYFLEHKEYTHWIISCDDGVPPINGIAKLIADIKKYDFPIISGVSTNDSLMSDDFLGVTIESPKFIHPTQIPQYVDFNLLPKEFKNLNGIIKISFQGNETLVIRRDIVEKMPYVRPEEEMKDNYQPWYRCSDFGYSVKCKETQIPIYCDLRVFYLHYKYAAHPAPNTYPSFVEKKNHEIIFEKAIRNVPHKKPAKLYEPLPEKYQRLYDFFYHNDKLQKEYEEYKPERKRIFIGTPFCNEEHSISLYVESLLNIDYPKKLIDVMWIENNSEDNTWEILQKYAEQIKDKYCSFQLLRMPCKQINPMKKITMDDYAKNKKLWDSAKINLAYMLKSGISYVNFRKIAVEQMIKVMHRLMDESLELNSDFFMFFFADMVIQPDTIKRYLWDMENIPDCGWIGCIHHGRYPKHIRAIGQDPLHQGLESPVIKVNMYNNQPLYYYENESNEIHWIVSDWNWGVNRNSWFLDESKLRNQDKNYPFPYGIYGLADEEVLYLQKNGKNIIRNVCATGHVIMFRKEVLQCRFKESVVESALQFERDMAKLGYYMYCDTYVYAKHISIDGKVYRNGLIRTDEDYDLQKIEPESPKEEKQLEPQKAEPRQGPHP